MFSDLFHVQLSFSNLILRAVIVYLFILILLRLSGKRQMGQMAPTEFVAILLISNAVQNSMNGGDNSLVGGLVLAFVLVALSNMIAYLTYKSRFFSTVFEGTPTLLIHKGKIVSKNLQQELMTETELKVLLRKQGLHSLHEIEIAILEADGTLSVTRNETEKDKK